jgi:hypothetical protein
VSKDRDDEEEKGIVIDITDYQEIDNLNELDPLTEQFLSSLNQSITERRENRIRSRFLYYMVNFLLFTQFLTFIMIAIMMSKIY